MIHDRRTTQDRRREAGERALSGRPADAAVWAQMLAGAMAGGTPLQAALVTADAALAAFKTRFK